jgi:hypothetical protein
MRTYFDNFLTNFLCKILFQSFFVFFVKLSFSFTPESGSTLVTQTTRTWVDRTVVPVRAPVNLIRPSASIGVA